MGNLFFSLPEIVRLAIIMLPIVGLAYLWNRYSLRRKLRRIAFEAEKMRIQEIRDVLDPIVALLDEDEAQAVVKIEEMAAVPFYRNVLHALLVNNQQQAHFPDNYLNQASFAESDLAFWLALPSEIGAPPDHIEFIEAQTKTFEDGEEPVDFYLLKFKMDPPHPLAERGWVVGITGPYPKDESSDSFESRSQATFSEFIALDEMSLSEHLDFILDRLFSTSDTIIPQE